VKSVQHELPKTRSFSYYKAEEGATVEFRLIYKGPLPADRNDRTGQSARAEDKHKLRKHFHLQLRELWKQQPDLRFQAETPWVREQVTPADRRIRPALPGEQGKSWIECIADDHITCNGNRFVPLVSEQGGFTCSLNILFLRRDNPGSLIQHGGDIDNRIKVLFDGLKMPMQVSELGGHQIEANENPFFVLLEDDKLVTSVSVTTDRLIIPQEPGEDTNDVLLVTHVTVVNPSAIFTGGRLV
jgi:hypothetical protein